MSKSRKFKVFLTLLIGIFLVLTAFLAVTWVLSHAWIFIVLGSLAAVGYDMVRKSALLGGRRTLL